MTQAFPVSGNIEPAAFPHLLVDLHRHGATGSLKVTGPHHPKALYFRSGRVLFGSSNDPRDQLGSILIESGKITHEQLDEVTAKVGPGNPLAKVLAESGFVNQRELGDAARVKVERILADVLSWDSGTFEFEDGVLPKGAVDLKLSTEKLLLSAVQRIPDRSFALRHIELRSVLAPVPEGEAALSEIRAEVWPLLERLDGRRTLKDAIALTRLDEFEAAKTACALLFLGVVRKSEAPAGEELDLAREAQSGLGAEDDAEPALFTMPSQPAAPGASHGFEAPAKPEAPFGFAAAAAEPERDAPFVFPEPAPPLAPELAFGGEPEPAPTVVLPDAAAPPKSGPTVTPAEPALSYPPPSFPPPVEAAAAPVPAFSAPEPAPEPERSGVAAVAVPLPSFTTEPPPRVSFDTVPGDRPAYTPSASGRPLPLIPPPPRRDAPSSSKHPSPAGDDAPEIAVAPSSSRPNLAALDELLNPSASGRRRPSADRPRSENWQPQFRPATASRRVALRATPQASSSRLPLILAALLMVVVGTVAAWYFLLRTPATPAPPPVTMVHARPTAPPRPATTPTPPPTTVAASPSAGGTSAPSPVPAATSAPPRVAPSPRATPVAPARATSSPASARVLLGRGALPEAAREFASSLRAGSRTRFSVQMLTACAPETVQKAVGAAGAGELIVLPVTLNGRACYRLCWGVYDDRQRAEAALATIPAYFRQGGAKPRVSALAELLP